MLSKQLQGQIEQEAKSSAADFNYYPGSTECEDLESSYTTAATKYAALYETAVARAERAEKALRDFAKQIKMHCNKMGIRSVVIQCIANRMEELDITEALTPKTGEDE